MYRYSGNSRYRSVMRSNRWQPIVIIAVLVIAVVVVLKLAGVGSLDEGNYERQRNMRLLSESQERDHAGEHPFTAWRDQHIQHPG